MPKLYLFLGGGKRTTGEKSLHYKLKAFSESGRKTILHEIAHFLLHYANYLRPVFLDHKSFVAGLEKEADYFAYLLMREWLEEESL